MIFIKVNENGTLHTIDCTVSDGVKYETVKFDFPKSWDGYAKTAVFRNGDITLSVILNSDSNLCRGVNECYIPYEVIKFPKLTVSVFGVLGNSRVTTAQAAIKVIQSGYGEGDEPTAPTPSEYEQLLNLANETKEIAQSVRSDADKGAFNGKDGYTPILGVDYFTIDENTEFIFEGGDAEQAIQTDIAVDGELSKASTNAIQNKAVATRLDEITAAIEQAKTEVLLAAYPIGAIYISAVSTSPSVLFGGAWVQIKDRFLLASGDAYLSGTTGGAKEHSHNIDPNKAYAQFYSPDGTGLFTGWRRGVNNQNWDSTEHFLMNGYSTGQLRVDGGVGVYGTSDEANNMPPYLAVYVWQRTA